ncbi:hypothetical protein [Methanolapillus africanus]|uniref:hypothetical protein n=1 Tax=Methanolapillus africanus TaxID=3028297 RepID=UPI0030B88AD3
MEKRSNPSLDLNQERFSIDTLSVTELCQFIEDLEFNSTRDKNRWIVNIDIDYFFIKDEESEQQKIIQFINDEFIEMLCDKLIENMEFIEMITIALSPSCCGGWTPSVRIAKLMCMKFGFEFPLSEDTYER